MLPFAHHLGRVANLVLPPRCPGCGSVVDADHRFCAACWTSLRFLRAPACAGCGVPFDYDRGAEARCAECLARPPRHSGVKAAVAYGPIARTVALQLKYGGRTAFAQTAALLMAPHLMPDRDLLVPVPMHRWRLWSRGFNQAALIATALSRLTGIRVGRTALLRQRATPVLRGIGAKGRRRAVAGAFEIPSDERAGVAGRSIVLVDDIYTSGATTDACVSTLLRAGAARVEILCWARVLDDDQHD